MTPKTQVSIAFVLIGIATVVLIGNYILTSEAPDLPTETSTSTSSDPVAITSERFTFVCPDMSSFTIAYSADAAVAELKTETNTYRLERVMSGSGARYQNQSLGVGFWEHQDEAQVQFPDSREPQTCRNQNSEEALNHIPADWSRYESPADDTTAFSIHHPSSTTIEQVQPTIYEIKFIGPDSEPNTEITDGYYASLQFVTATSAAVYAKQQGATTSAPHMTFLDQTAYQYVRRSALSEQLVPHFVLPLPDQPDTILDISYQTYGEDKSVYEAEILQILETLSIPTIPSKSITEDPTENESSDIARRVSVSRPVGNATVTSPIELSGAAPGNWFFEASAPVVVVDWEGRIIGESFITAEGDWMTTELVPFSGTVNYDLASTSPYTRGAIIFQRANPSGLPENDAAEEIPVNLTPTE